MKSVIGKVISDSLGHLIRLDRTGPGYGDHVEIVKLDGTLPIGFRIGQKVVGKGSREVYVIDGVPRRGATGEVVQSAIRVSDGCIVSIGIDHVQLLPEIKTYTFTVEAVNENEARERLLSVKPTVKWVNHQ